MKHSVPNDESTRKAVLDSYEILDTPRDESFDHIARLASSLLDMPIAVISMVDTDRIWFKSSVGFDIRQIDREPGFCATAILSDDFYIVEDALNDSRTRSNSLVTGNFGIRFYAAAVLTTRTGHNLGTIGVIDTIPRTLTPKQRGFLQDLSRIVMDQVEMRLVARQAFHFQRDVAYQIAHDLKKPLFSIKMLTEFLQDPVSTEDERAEFLRLIHESCNQGTESIEQFLEVAQSADQMHDLHLQRENLSILVESLLSRTRLAAERKSQVFHADIDSDVWVACDTTSLRTVVENLLDNAMKYTPEDGEIRIRVWSEGGYGRIQISDNGLGFTTKDLRKAFKQYGKLSARPTGGESSSGFGLWIAHRLIRANNGQITLHSEGRGTGSVFEIRLVSQN